MFSINVCIIRDIAITAPKQFLTIGKHGINNLIVQAQMPELIYKLIKIILWQETINLVQLFNII